MKTRAIKLLILCVVASCQFPIYAVQQAVSKKHLSIKEAYEKKMIDYRLSGTDGSHYGDCMAIVLQNNIDSALVLQVMAGTQLMPAEADYQTMIVTKSATYELPALGIKSYNIYAMCGEYYDTPPDANTVYYVRDMARNDVVKLAKYLEFNAKQNYKGQYAMWSVTDQISNKDLEKYGATSIDINDVLRMTDEINIPVKLTYVEVKEEEKAARNKKSIYKREQAKVIYKNLPHPKDQVKPKEKPKTAIEKYGFGGLGVLTLLSGIGYLALRKKKNNKRKV